LLVDSSVIEMSEGLCVSGGFVLYFTLRLELRFTESIITQSLRGFFIA
jgi:hypothetical protein